ADAEGNRDFATVFDVECDRRTHSRQGSITRGYAADDQSLSQQTTDLQRRLEDLDLLAYGHPYSLRRASYRFLAASWQLCGRQQGAIGENRVAAFLGYPDHSARADCYVLHDVRTSGRDWEGKGDANIFLTDAYPTSLNEALMTQAKKNGWTVVSMKDDWKTVFAFENK